MEEIRMTPFDIWVEETESYIRDLVGRHRPFPTMKDAYRASTPGWKEPVVERMCRKWFDDGMSIEDAAERMILCAARKGVFKDPIEWVCFPAWPHGSYGEPDEAPGMGWSHLFSVVCDNRTVSYYDPHYYRCLDEVLAHIREQAEKGEVYVGGDYIVWHRQTAVALVRLHYSGRIKMVRLSKRSDEIWKGNQPLPMGWPSRDEWIASGCGPLVYDKSKAQRQRDAEDIDE